jgi:hypothetical protein
LTENKNIDGQHVCRRAPLPGGNALIHLDQPPPTAYCLANVHSNDGSNAMNATVRKPCSISPCRLIGHTIRLSTPVMAVGTILMSLALPAGADTLMFDSPIQPPPPTSHKLKTDPKVTETLKFFNGDILNGVLLDLPNGGPLRWQHPEVKTPIEFSDVNIAEVLLVDRGPASEPATTNRVSVTLTNDDLLTGQLVSLDKEILMLDTTYAGRLNIQRSIAKRLAPHARQLGLLYTGPNNMEEWTQQPGSDSWRYGDGELVGTGSGMIGMDVGLKDMVRIDFDLRWRQHLAFYFSIYTSAPNNRGGRQCYMFYCSGNQVALQRFDPNIGERNLSETYALFNIKNKPSGQFSFLINKKDKTFSLFFDGDLVKTWTDPDEFIGSGTWICFTSHGNPVKVSNIRVSDWDGFLHLGTPQSSDGGDALVFHNGDKISGVIESIINSQINFTTAYATLVIPIERIRLIVFDSKQASVPRRQTGDVFASFSTGGGITFNLESLDANSLTVSSETFGKASFKRSAFNRIKFHIYDERHQAKSDPNDF